jgi:hypothetical protein
VALALAGAGRACGPDFPNSYYAMSGEQLLAAPEGFFAAEIARLTPEGATPFRAVRMPNGDGHRHSVEIDVADLQRALMERGVAQSGQIVWAYEGARIALGKWAESARLATGEKTPAPALPDLTPDPRVPVEFARYLAGAVAWHRDDWAQARAAWQEVLALPAAERRYRSVWAAFMLGRVSGRLAESADGRERAENAAEAGRRFRETRTLVADGFPDPLGLAAASYGWEARAARARGDFAAEIRLYLTQQATGDETALNSLQFAAAHAARSAPESFRTLARDAVARRVMTAYFVSRGGPAYSDDVPRVSGTEAWAAALGEAGVRAVPEADRLAWLAYEAGDFSLAREWAALAAAEAPEAQWIRAKLALRGGDLRNGEKLLRAAAAGPRLAEAHRRRIAAELGRVCLAQDDLAGALAAWMGGGHWEDAAFVAERVMTVDELVAFVEANPGAMAPGGPPEGYGIPGDLNLALRNLLARRLVREGRPDQAESYFSDGARARFHGYLADVRTGFDGSRSADERAAGFWRAAQCVREHGMELLGTELEPDWRIFDGEFSLEATAAVRRQGPAQEGGPFAPTPLELRRFDAQPAPARRFHYRYRAAELAWWAASLLPNEADETARILNTAGGWLKARDPEAARPFYQSLVIRCGGTALGREARRRHWLVTPQPPAERAGL